MTRRNLIVKEILANALDLALNDSDWQDEWGDVKIGYEGFCRVMFPDDDPLETYSVTREEYEEILYDAHALFVRRIETTPA